MTFTPAQAALLVRRNGGTDEEAIFLASVVPTESGGNPTVVNTTSPCGTENGRILRAVGLFQVCEYSSRGTREQLQDPDHNAREALVVLRAQGIGAWTGAAVPAAADEARRALAAGGEPPMETWHPCADRAEATTAGSSYIGVPWKLVIHTVEAPPSSRYLHGPSYYGGSSWPHATIDEAGIHQHLPIDVSARALFHQGVDTNNANAIQCEVMGQAAHVDELPDSTMGHLADWLSWCAAQVGMDPITFATFVAFPASAGEEAAQRFSDQEWLDFTGICGHEHVPSGNDHGDPGAIDTTKLAALMGTTQEDALVAVSQADFDYVKGLVMADNAALGRIEVAVRDQVGGLGTKVDALSAKLDALLARKT